MFNKAIVPKLTVQLTTVSLAFSNVKQGISPSGEQNIEIHKQLWNWINNIATIFWCLA